MKAIVCNLRRRVVVATSMIYLVSYAFFMLRIFAFDWNLGYGLGDLVYVAFFTIVSVLTVVAFLLPKVTEAAWIAWGVAFMNIGSTVYIWLIIYVFYGPEVS